MAVGLIVFGTARFAGRDGAGWLVTGCRLATRLSFTATSFSDNCLANWLTLSSKSLPEGLVTKSNAPARRASVVIFAPALVRPLTITAAVAGHFSRNCRTASMPFIRGISRSMVTKSGFSSKHLSIASTPSLARATISTPGNDSSAVRTTLRDNAESSTIIHFTKSPFANLPGTKQQRLQHR